MRRLIILAAALTLCASVVRAQTPIYPVQYTVSTLPAAATMKGRVVNVVDAIAPGRCDAGGGSYKTPCYSDGSSWAPWGAVSTGAETVTNVTASTPVHSSGGPTPNITIDTANGSQPGALSATDWNTFNGKANAFSVGNGLSLSGGTLSAALGAGLTFSSGNIVVASHIPNNITFDSDVEFDAGFTSLNLGRIFRDSIGATSTDGLQLTNSTAAAAGAQQWSPRLHWKGQGWKTDATAASQTVDWIAELKTVQGTTAPAGNLVFSYQVNGGGYVPALEMKPNGDLHVVGDIAAGSLDTSSGLITTQDLVVTGTLTVGGAPITGSGRITDDGTTIRIKVADNEQIALGNTASHIVIGDDSTSPTQARLVIDNSDSFPFHFYNAPAKFESYVYFMNTLHAESDAEFLAGIATYNAGVFLHDGTSGNRILITPPALSGSWDFTLPPNAGSNGQVLTTNGSGVTSWVTPSPTTSLTVSPTITITDSATNTASNILTAKHNTSGTPAVGFGSAMLFQLQDSTTTNQDAAQIVVKWGTATHGTRSAVIDIQGIDAGSSGSLQSFGRFDAFGLTLSNTISAQSGQITDELNAGSLSAGSVSGNFFLVQGTSSGIVTVQGAAAAGTWTMTLPTSAGTNGYVLKTNGSGVTSWTQLASTDLSDSSNIAKLNAANAFTAAPTITISDSALNSSSTTMTIRHNTSGTPSANFGSTVLFQLQDSTTTNQDAARMIAKWTNATHASRSGGFVIEANRMGTWTELASFDFNGINLGAGMVTTVDALTVSNDTSMGGGLDVSGSTTMTDFTASSPSFIWIADSTTSTLVDLFTLNHDSTTSATAGFGASQLFKLRTSTTANRDAGRFGALWTTATDASRTSAFVWQVVNNAGSLAEAARLTPSGFNLASGSTYQINGSQIAFSNIANSLACSQMPALTGNVTTSAGSCSTTIAAGVVTNSMLAGSIAFSKLTGTDRTLTAGSGLTGGGDLSADRTFNVGAGAGITVNADDVALTTPGTLTVSTSNSSSGNHTHAITTSSNPGAAAAILATDSGGAVSLVGLTVTPVSGQSTTYEGTTVNAQTGTSYTVVSGDNNKLLTLNNASAISVTLPQATGSFTTGWTIQIGTIGAGTATITPTTSTIDATRIGGSAAATSITITTGHSVRLTSNGTNYVAYNDAGRY